MSTPETERTSYDPRDYWNSREHPNTAVDPGLNPDEVKYLGSRLNGVGSVLEVGPGVGRLFPLYKSVPTVATVDISFNYLTRARAAATAAGIKVNDNYLIEPQQKLPFADQEFDLGVTSHVLMHIPFELIEHTMSEAARCCKQVVVISAWHKAWPKKGATFDPKWHCFTHDYEAICRSIGCQYSNYTPFAQRETDGSFAFSFARA